jgi:hypothetical protein
MIARWLRSLIAVVGVLLLGCGLAEASPISISFAFQATDFIGDNFAIPPVDTVSGNVSFTFEERILCGGAG